MQYDMGIPFLRRLSEWVPFQDISHVQALGLLGSKDGKKKNPKKTPQQKTHIESSSEREPKLN